MSICFACTDPQSLSQPRYILSMAVADWSGQAWLQGFNDVGLIVFGMPANDLHNIKVRLPSLSLARCLNVSQDARREQI